MTERSGTDEQILSRLRRGDSTAEIRDELGCGERRVHAIARHFEIALVRRRSAVLTGTKRTKSITEAGRVTPWVRATVPQGWAHVDINYDEVADGRIVMTLVKDEAPDES